MGSSPTSGTAIIDQIQILYDYNDLIPINVDDASSRNVIELGMFMSMIEAESVWYDLKIRANGKLDRFVPIYKKYIYSYILLIP